MSANDLSPIQLGTLSWEEGSRAASLAAVYGHVTKGAKDAVEWYARSRRPKQWAATGLRSSAVLLVSVSAWCRWSSRSFRDRRGATTRW